MLVIRQKGESQNGYFKKTKHAKFSESEHFSPPDMLTYVSVSGGMKCSFLGKFGVLCFLETPVLRFTLLPYYRHNENVNQMLENRSCYWVSAISGQCSHSIHPENTRKPKAFSVFREHNMGILSRNRFKNSGKLSGFTYLI